MNGRYDFLILHLLSREEMYGFQVIKKVSDRCTDAEFELKTGMLYPLVKSDKKRCLRSPKKASS